MNNSEGCFRSREPLDPIWKKRKTSSLIRMSPYVDDRVNVCWRPSRKLRFTCFLVYPFPPFTEEARGYASRH